ncbi:MAG: ribonuclease H family protein, partial [Fusobacteriaceae bacterium]
DRIHDMEAEELPLYLRRIKLALLYWVKLKGSGEEQPMTKVIGDCWEYSQKLKGTGFGWSINSVAEEYGLNMLEYGPNTVWGNVPPWIMPVPVVDLQLTEQKREWIENNVDNIGYLVQEYVKRKYFHYLSIFTDGSKDPGSDHVGVGVYIPEFDITTCKRINNKLSVFTAEVVAIILGLQWVEEIRPERVVICSDSIAALRSLNANETKRDDLLKEISMILLRIHRSGIMIQFCWVPAHVGVEGNEKADSIAKNALKLKEEELMKVPFGKGEAKSIIKTAVENSWQMKWDTDSKGKHYYNILKSIKMKAFKGNYRREEVAFSRIKLGHTGLKSTLFKIGKCITDKCDICNVTENVEHVVMWCKKYNAERNILQDKMYEMEREWSLQGILGMCEKTREISRALFHCLLFLKIQD